MSVKVLIIESNTVARALLHRVVVDSFSDVYQITEVKNIDEAYAALEMSPDTAITPTQSPYQLILLDLELEDGQALHLLQRLARYPAKTVITTLYADAEHLFPALQRGAKGYLLKEERFEVLVEDLQKIIRGQPPLSPSVARQLQAYFNLDEPQHPLLTHAETEVLSYLCKGFNLKEIANMMAIKWALVNEHIKSIYNKINLYYEPPPSLDPAVQRHLA